VSTARDTELAIFARLDSIEREMRFQSRLLEVLAARPQTDASTVSVREAALFLGVSVDAVRDRFRGRMVTLGGGKFRIPTEVLRDAYVSPEPVRAAARRERARKTA
jgi:hypothetical protein